MDGFKKKLSRSLQFKLSLSISLCILVSAVVAGIASFIFAFIEANELQDDMLREIAAQLDRLPLPTDTSANAGISAGVKGRPTNHDGDSPEIIVQYLNNKVQTKDNLATTPFLPATLPDGLFTRKIHDEAYRIFVKKTANGQRIAVAQETEIRDDIAYSSALHTIAPLLILVPLLLWVVASMVRKLFRPVASLSTEIDQRTENDFQPVNDDRVPTEVFPFVVAINRLLARVGLSMEAQRRFVANAAHELRSPLTAMSLQAERLADVELPDLAQSRLATLRLGIARGRNLLDQLLTLAQAQSTVTRAKSNVSVQSVFRRVLEDLMPLADAKKINIGVEGEDDCVVHTDELDLMTLVKNVVGNAICYTPEGGKIDLAIEGKKDGALLTITDSGPGIPLTERERVFDPFYRVLGSEQMGSGLGLSIVKSIASKIGAQLQLEFANEALQSGLRVIVFLPIAKAQ